MRRSEGEFYVNLPKRIDVAKSTSLRPFVSLILPHAGSHDAHGLGQLVARVRLVPEELRRVDNTAVDFGLLHHLRMAVGRGVPVLRPAGAGGHTHPVRDRRHIVLFLDIRVLQKRYLKKRTRNAASARRCVFARPGVDEPKSREVKN